MTKPAIFLLALVGLNYWPVFVGKVPLLAFAFGGFMTRWSGWPQTETALGNLQ
ncbi:MAG TPA: hypothetical protein VE422_38565 [Terriglobia bacterium]|nr:hypothetical protein [Terriglobia bacterium]